MQKQSIPNYLTASRYAVLPFLLAAWHLPAPIGYWLSLALMLLACTTDFLDGYLARKWNAQSELGRLLDPNADKVLIAAGLVLLASSGHASVVAVCLILGRELFVSGLREFACERQITLHVTRLAKWKTTTQMAAVLVLMLALALHSEMLLWLGCALLWLAAALTLISGYDYWRKIKPYVLD